MQGALVIAAVVQKTKETCVDAPEKEAASPNRSIFNDKEVVLLRALVSAQLLCILFSYLS